MAEGNRLAISDDDTLIYKQNFFDEESTDSFWTEILEPMHVSTSYLLSGGAIAYINTRSAHTNFHIDFPEPYTQEILKIRFDFSSRSDDWSYTDQPGYNALSLKDSAGNAFITFTIPTTWHAEQNLRINGIDCPKVTFPQSHADPEIEQTTYSAELTIDFFNKVFNYQISEQDEVLAFGHDIDFLTEASNFQQLFIELSRGSMQQPPAEDIYNNITLSSFYIYESVRPAGEWAILEIGQGPLNGENYIDVESAYLSAIPEGQERHYIVFCADSKNLGYADVENIEYLGNGVYRVYFKEGVTQIRESFDCHIIQLNNIADIYEGELRGDGAWNEVSQSSSLESPDTTDPKKNIYYYQYWPQATSSMRLAGKHIPIVYPKNISDSVLFDHLIETKIYNNRLQFIADEQLSATLPIVIIDFK